MISVLFGGLLTIAGSYGLGCALTRCLDLRWPFRFAAGAAVLSLIVFALMAAGVAHRPVLGIVAGVAALGIVLRPPRVARPRIPWWAAVCFAAFGTWYLVNAMAPEVEADPNVYHLTAARAARHHGGFERDITFYGSLPHATELLFAIAFAFGGGPAAKVVHFSFLIATVPVILAIARRLKLPDLTGWGAALLYFMAPVVGAAGTATFNDGALVFATVSTIAVLLGEGPPWLAGLCAGFCYAIKMTGGLAVPLGLVMLGSKRRWRDAAVFSAAASVMIAPWLIRNFVLTGNPFAPFFNRWFPNRWFRVSTEQQLAAFLRTYGGVSFLQRFPELLWGWRVQGIISPVFVLAPIALLGLRKRRQWLLLGLAILLLIPWFLNAGSRFLMPALPFLALAMLAPLPRAGVAAVVAAQAILAWPQIVTLYDPLTWRVHRFPISAAFGAEPNYSWDYRVARMIDASTPPSARILDIHGVHAAHIDREFTGWWQSAPGQQAFQVLEFAYLPGEGRLYEVRADFPKQPVSAVRIESSGSALSIVEIEFYQGEFRFANRRRWSLAADANPWEIPLAFDRNLASRWKSLEAAGTRLVIDFEGREELSAIRVVGTHRDGDSGTSINLKKPDGSWHEVQTTRSDLPKLDLRKQAVEFLRHQGFTHIVAHVGSDGPGQLGFRLANDAPDWGLEVLGNLDTVYVFRLPVSTSGGS